MSATASTLVTTARRSGSIRRSLSSLGPVGIASAVVIAIAVIVAILSPWLVPHDPNAPNLADAYAPISGTHLLGADAQGRDIFSRLLAGSRLSLLGPLAVATMTTALAVVLAIAGAWYRGWVDGLLSGFVNLLFAFPGIILAILAATVFGPSLQAAVVALTIAYAPAVARVLRSAAVTERNQAYVAALEIQGFSSWTICLRHILPNMSALIWAELTLQFGFAMVDISAISFLGLGTQPPSADWGVMVADGEQNGLLQGYPQEALAAGIAIFVLVLAFTLLGEQLAGASGVDYRSGGSWLSLRAPRRRIAAIEAAGAARAAAAAPGATDAATSDTPEAGSATGGEPAA